MNRTTLLAAVAIAILGAVLFVVRKRRYIDVVTGGELIGVLRVVQDVPAGEPIFHTSLRVEYRPATFVERRHVGLEDALTVVGLRAATDVRAGSTLVWSDLIRGNENRDSDVSVSESLPIARRAVNVTILSYAFNSLLSPGDRVDVFFTANQAEANVPTTVLLAQNVDVVSDASRRSGNDDEEKQWERSVTLSTTPDQATDIKHAANTGKLTFVLRHHDDERIVDALPYITHQNLIASEEAQHVIRRRRNPNDRVDVSIERIQ